MLLLRLNLLTACLYTGMLVAARISVLFPHPSPLAFLRYSFLPMSQSLILNMQSNSFHMNRETCRNKNEGTDGDTDLRMPTCCGIDIEDLSIVQLQQYLAHGAFSIRALTSCYLERITRLNPLLRFVCVLHGGRNCVGYLSSLTP